MVNASGNAARPNTVTPDMPKSRVKTAICEVTIRPEVAIIDIITDISQNNGVRSMLPGRVSATAAAAFFGRQSAI